MKIQHVSYEQRIRELALSFPETYEDSPWGHPVFKVGDNKMFAAMSDGDDLVSLTVKLTPEEREIALHFPHVSVARNARHCGWATAEASAQEPVGVGPGRWCESSRGCSSRGACCGCVSRSVVEGGLPDNSDLERAEGAAGSDAARAIGRKLAAQAVVVRSNGRVQDLRLPLEE